MDRTHTHLFLVDGPQLNKILRQNWRALFSFISPMQSSSHSLNYFISLLYDFYHLNPFTTYSAGLITMMSISWLDEKSQFIRAVLWSSSLGRNQITNEPDSMIVSTNILAAARPPFPVAAAGRMRTHRINCLPACQRSRAAG